MKVYILARGKRYVLYHQPNVLNVLPTLQILSCADGTLVITISFLTLELNIEL